jgi:hypothetical protein
MYDHDAEDTRTARVSKFEEERRTESSPTSSTAAPLLTSAQSGDQGLIGDRERMERKRKHDDSDPNTADNDDEAKKRRNMCYQCGGYGHFLALCPSPPGSADGTGQQCYKCMGRGHIQMRCPNNLPPNHCYRCGMVGHRARYFVVVFVVATLSLSLSSLSTFPVCSIRVVLLAIL